MRQQLQHQISHVPCTNTITDTESVAPQRTGEHAQKFLGVEAAAPAAGRAADGQQAVGARGVQAAHVRGALWRQDQLLRRVPPQSPLHRACNNYSSGFQLHSTIVLQKRTKLL